MSARWAPDPTGRHELRWYDGTVWTHHVADHGDPSGDPLLPGTELPPPSPGAAPPPPSPWGAWSPAGPAAPQVREHPDGTTVLVLGILSLVVCGVLGPVAWSKGNAALQEIDLTPGVTWTNRGAVQAGRICGIVASVILALTVLVFVVALFAASGSSS